MLPLHKYAGSLAEVISTGDAMQEGCDSASKKRKEGLRRVRAAAHSATVRIARRAEA